MAVNQGNEKRQAQEAPDTQEVMQEINALVREAVSDDAMKPRTTSKDYFGDLDREERLWRALGLGVADKKA